MRKFILTLAAFIAFAVPANEHSVRLMAVKGRIIGKGSAAPVEIAGCKDNEHYAITAAHCIEPGYVNSLETSPGVFSPCDVVGIDYENDCALLKCAVPFKFTLKLAANDELTAAGYPGAEDQYEEMTGPDVAVIVKVVVRPGMSGGAVINKHGELVGVICGFLTRIDGNTKTPFASHICSLGPIKALLKAAGK